MTYDLFHQLLCLSSNQNDSSEFLRKLEHMTVTDVVQAYASLQTSSRNPLPASGITRSAWIGYCGFFRSPTIFSLFFHYMHAYKKFRCQLHAETCHDQDNCCQSRGLNTFHACINPACRACKQKFHYTCQSRNSWMKLRPVFVLLLAVLRNIITSNQILPLSEK